MKYATIAATLLIAVTVIRFISPILKSRWVWAIGTVVTILTMTGGYMFVRIREMPYTGGDGGWIAGGYQNQFGQETQVVALICMLFILDSELDYDS
jgi:oligosaccharyltransferase complex subunit gamma